MIGEQSKKSHVGSGSIHAEWRPVEPLELNRRLEEARLAKDAARRPARAPQTAGEVRTATAPLSDAEVISRAGSAKNGAKFARLWAGDDSGYQRPSDADLALAGILAYWIGPDPARIAALMKRSGFGRAGRYDGRDKYLTRTVKKAIEGVITLKTITGGYHSLSPQNLKSDNPPSGGSFKSDNLLSDAWKLTTAGPAPAWAERFKNANLRRLALLCHHLQALRGGRFGLDERTAARLLGVSQPAAHGYFRALIDGGHLNIEVERNYGKRLAREYTFSPEGHAAENAADRPPAAAAA